MAIARALFQGTGILLADEPTSDLDEENTDIVAKLLRRAADSGKTVFVVTTGWVRFLIPISTTL